jgi:pyrroloquinoline-quinone synthase
MCVGRTRAIVKLRAAIFLGFLAFLAVFVFYRVRITRLGPRCDGTNSLSTNPARKPVIVNRHAANLWEAELHSLGAWEVSGVYYRRTMDRIAQLDAIVAQFDLNGHPFYQDWRMGTLPMEKLRAYAAEYARFVDTIDEGWTTIGETYYAQEEVEHELLWADFQRELGAEGRQANTSTETLVVAARNLMADPASAYGALYAFEAQQPKTSQSKLDGLNEHYSLTEQGKEYFRVHAGDVAEAELLRKRIVELSDDDFAKTKTACAIVCAAMWGALDGVYFTSKMANA